MSKRVLLFSLITIISISACSDDDDNGNNGSENCETEGMRYTEDIKPIIDANCATAGCHNSGTRAMTTYEEVRDYALDGVLVTRINLPSSNALSMPPSGPLDDCTIEKINAWVNDGAPM